MGFRLCSYQNFNQVGLNALTDIINVNDVCKQSAGFENVATNVIAPIKSDQRLRSTKAIAVILRRNQVLNFAIFKSRPASRGPVFIDNRNGEYVHSSGFQGSGNFAKRPGGMKDMFNNIL